MDSIFQEKFSKPLSFLNSHFSRTFGPNKPLIPHAERVGYTLYAKDFSDTVVTAGLLHDVLEFSSITASDLVQEFGQEVVDLVSANSKDRSIEDKHERRVDIVERCAGAGEEALAIKIVGVLDSFSHYLPLKNISELERCVEHAQLLRKKITPHLETLFGSELLRVEQWSAN